MRKYFLILLLLISGSGFSQAPNIIYGKDVIIQTRDTSSAELTIKNSTRNVLGYFKNIGGGKGQYVIIPQTDITGLPDSLLARYTKAQADARFKSISYVPAWLEITDKPANFSTTHALSNDIQDSLLNKVSRDGSYANPSWITSLDYSKLTGTVPTWNQNTTGNAATVTNGVYTTGSYANPSWITSLDYSKLTGTVPTWNQNTTGNAATVTNGVYTTGSYANPSWITSLDYSKLTGTVPTWNQNTTGNAATVTNGVYTTGSYANPSWITSLDYSKLTGTVPTWNQNTTGNAATVTNGVYTTGSYANPSWITELAWSKVSGAPAFITGINSSMVTTALGYTPENLTNKGVANGYADLDASGKIPASRIDFGQTGQTFVVASQAAMLAVSGANVGALAIRTDQNKNYRLIAQPASTLGNWQVLLSPDAPVQSVNGFTGNVNLLTTHISEGSNYWWTAARSRAAQSLTTSGSSGSATYDNTTGVLNIPTYTLSGLGGQPALSGTGFVKISGTTISYDNSTYLTTETDPTIYSWAKAASKPTYSWGEITGTVPTWNQNTTGNAATATTATNWSGSSSLGSYAYRSSGLAELSGATFTGALGGTTVSMSGLIGTDNSFRINGNGAVPTASALQIGTNGVGTRLLYNVPTGGEHNLTVNGTTYWYVNATGAGTSGIVTASAFQVGNGQYYRATRASGSLVTDMIGIPSGSDNVRLLSTGDFVFVNGSLVTAATITNAGAATFTSDIRSNGIFRDSQGEALLQTQSNETQLGSIGASFPRSFRLFTGNATALTISTSQAATFTSSITANGQLTVTNNASTINSLLLRTDLGTGGIVNTGVILGKAQSNYNAASIVYTHSADGSSNNQIGLGFWGNDNLFTLKGTGAGTFLSSVTSTGFIKSGSSDSYFLLGGGGHVAASNYATTASLSSYVNTTGNQYEIGGNKSFLGAVEVVSLKTTGGPGTPGVLKFGGKTNDTVFTGGSAYVLPVNIDGTTYYIRLWAGIN